MPTPNTFRVPISSERFPHSETEHLISALSDKQRHYLEKIRVSPYYTLNPPSEYILILWTTLLPILSNLADQTEGRFPRLQLLCPKLISDQFKLRSESADSDNG